MELTARQVQFADAALEILTREGMAGVSFRTVATQSGMSLGAVQKAFPSKDVMLEAMFQRMREVAVAPALAEPGRPTLRGWLTELTLTVLPLDEARLATQRQASAFAEHAANAPEIAASLVAADETLLGNLAALIGRGIGEGEVMGVDPAAAARAWLAFTQGLATQLLYAPRPEVEVRGDVEWTIGRLLGAGPTAAPEPGKTT